jgi:hypothetical protein
VNFITFLIVELKISLLEYLLRPILNDFRNNLKLFLVFWICFSFFFFFYKKKKIPSVLDEKSISILHSNVVINLKF